MMRTTLQHTGQFWSEEEFLDEVAAIVRAGKETNTNFVGMTVEREWVYLSKERKRATNGDGYYPKYILTIDMEREDDADDD